MSIETLKNSMPEMAKDIKLNLSTILTEEGAPDLKLQQIFSIALASAYAIKNRSVIQSILSHSKTSLNENEIKAAQMAATIMAMNNIYYRFTHIANDKTYATMSAKLRMNFIANPGVNKVDFELNCLAVSVINGCGMCIDAHAAELIKTGVTQLGIQSAVRIASVLNATAMAIEITENSV